VGTPPEDQNGTTIPDVRAYAESVTDSSLGLIVSLIVMVLVERQYGTAGLGFFAHLLAVFIFAGYLSAFGVPDYLERAIAKRRGGRFLSEQIAADSVLAILVLSLVAAILVLVLFAWGAPQLHPGNTATAYVCLAIALPFRNYGILRTSILHATGHHEQAFRLRARRRLLFLGVMAVLTTLELPAAFIALGFPMTEVLLLVTTRGKVAMPPLSRAIGSFRNLRNTLREGQRTLFTDEALEVLFYIDLLVIGLFLPADSAGVYAEASFLARVFLVLPLAVQPILRQRYCQLAASEQLDDLSNRVRRSSRSFFFGHAVIVLYFALFYPTVLHTFFAHDVTIQTSVHLFAIMSVGLLFYSSVAASTPVYEALDKPEALRKIVIGIFLLNLGLNFYLVPFAKLTGAAAATSISMLTFFLFFGRGLEGLHRLDKTRYAIAGASLYVCYTLLHEIDLGPWVTIFAVPLTSFLFFYLMGFFKEDRTRAQVISKTAH